MRAFGGNRGTGVALAVLCVAQFVVVLDATVVATALPTIGAELGFAPAQLGWVVTAYTVVLAGLLLLGGRLADARGDRSLFRVGLVVFTAASLACALAWSPEVLVGARAVQGAGAALLSPAALSALTSLVQGSGARGRALGWWTAAGAGGGASGWVVGGLVTELAGWRWVFAVNVPMGLVALLLARTALAVPPRRPGARSTWSRLDLGGSVLLTTGIALACLGCTLLGEDVTSTRGWVVAAASGVVLALAVGHERRTADPLVSGRLLRTPGVVVGNLTAATLTGSTTPAMLTAVIYVQQTAGLSPARGALLFPAFNLAVIGGSLLGPAVLARTGVRLVLLTGFAAVIAGTALLLLLPPQGVPVLLLLVAFSVSGVGLGAASVASTTAGTISVAEGDRGVAAGLLSSTAQLGQALGLAAITPLVASAAPMTGYRLGFVAAAVVGVVGLLVALGYRHRPADAQASTAGGRGPCAVRSSRAAGPRAGGRRAAR